MLFPMGDIDDGILASELGYESTGGACGNHKNRVGPPWIHFAIKPQQLEFRGPGLLRRHDAPNRSCVRWRSAATPWIGLGTIGPGSPSS